MQGVAVVGERGCPAVIECIFAGYTSLIVLKMNEFVTIWERLREDSDASSWKIHIRLPLHRYRARALPCDRVGMGVEAMATRDRAVSPVP